jgi:hypothetical protein
MHVFVIFLLFLSLLFYPEQTIHKIQAQQNGLTLDSEQTNTEKVFFSHEVGQVQSA